MMLSMNVFYFVSYWYYVYDWINVLIRKGFEYIYGIFYVWYFLYKKILKFFYTFYTEPINPLCINGFNGINWKNRFYTESVKNAKSVAHQRIHGIRSFYTEKRFFHCMMKILAISLYHNDTMCWFFSILRWIQDM